MQRTEKKTDTRGRLVDKTISIIMPTLNEKDMVRVMYTELKKVLETIGIKYEIIFVDDNSPDGTVDILRELRTRDKGVKYILMSRCFGDQVCLMAGFDYASGDIIVTMDADMQHPPEDLPRMIAAWQAGHDIVIMRRTEAGHSSFFKKWTEILFYMVINRISKTPIFYRFAGFALMDQKVARALRRHRECAPFLRGLIALVGFSVTELEYKEAERPSGRTKYSLLKMASLALTGITAFSDAPLYLSFYLGLLAVASTACYSLYVLFYHLYFGMDVAGYTSLILIMVFLGGVQLISIGVIGVYLSRIFMESKRRPNYIVQELKGVTRQNEDV